MQQEKCKTCEFWVADDPSTSSGQAIDATPKTQPLQQGKCYRNPPTTQLMQMPGKARLNILTKQMEESTQIQMLPILPPTFENHFCGEHPDAVRRRANELIYSPSVHGDGNGGFNRAPQLSEALRFSQADQIQSMKNRLARLIFIRDESKTGWNIDDGKEYSALLTALQKVDPDFKVT